MNTNIFELNNDIPVSGKTYTLFGSAQHSDEYYSNIKNILSNLFTNQPDKQILLIEIRKASVSRKHFLHFNKNYAEASQSINQLKDYTKATASHLENISFWNKWNKTIGLKEFQYIMFMLEIELLNSINKDSFYKSNYKIALLPHCIHDLSKTCNSTIDGLDYQCKQCSKKCFINYISHTLKEKNINSYIWKTLSLKSMLKQLIKEHGTVSVLGIACVPELTYGMRRCDMHHIPVLGLPLDANRCRRWFGEFLDNSININALYDLLN